MTISVNKNGLLISVGTLIVLSIFFVTFSLLSLSFALKAWELLLLLLLILTFFITIKKYGVLSEFTLFLCSFALFLCVFPVQDLFGLRDFCDLKIISYSKSLSLETAIKTIQCLTLGLYMVLLSVNCFDYCSMDKTMTIENEGKPYDRMMLTVFIIIAVLSIPYKVFLATIVQYGEYTSMYTTLRTVGFIRVSEYAKDALFPFLIVCVVCGVSKKQMKVIIVIYGLIAALDVFSGRRATFFEEILFVLWFYNKFINRIKIRKTIIAGVTLLIISAIMVQFRNATSEYSLLNNGHSVYITSLSIDNAHILNSTTCNELGAPYTFGLMIKDVVAIYYKLTGQISPFHDGQTYLTLQHSSYLGWELTYLLKPTAFLNGYGMGSSYIAEAYLSHGMIGIIFYSLIIFGSLRLSRNFRGAYLYSLYFVLIKNFFEIPRANFFKFLIEWLLTLIILVIVRFVFKLLKYDKEIDRQY